ncbi:MAG: DegT/DnrJ/EryC1/StrS family aminotransferase [Ginsengibacter sp.]
MSDNFIPLMSPDIQDSDIQAVTQVLRSGMLVQGIFVDKLEKILASYLHVKHAIAVANGTASLHLALIALGVREGDEVIVPALSYIATANVVELVGATPVFVDVSPDTFNIDVKQIEHKITDKTKCIIPVHEFGLASDMHDVMKIAKKHSLQVIEDAACALGATYKEQYAGTFGDVGSFSFHPRKAITGGEGGLLVTNNDALADKFRILRNHGISMQNGKMKFVAPGFNYRLTDFQAAMIFSQFQRLEQILSYKNKLAGVYFQELKATKNIILPTTPDDRRHTWQSFHLLLGDDIIRDHLIARLKEAAIGTNYGAQCIPYQQYFQEKYELDCQKLFPNALRAFKQGLVLPLYEKLSFEDIKKVSITIKKIILNA